ncbi:MAG: TonB-dependent receptor [Muribaculaceae bacterium]|nr:TonB-dependent receptor [Muribaculaceae bacterium]
MKNKLLLSLSIAFLCAGSVCAGNITLRAVDRPASTVFEEIMRQSGKNYVYPSGMLDKLKVSLNLKDVSLTEALDRMFENTGIRYKIRGNNVTLFEEVKEKKTLKLRKTVSGFVREAGSGEALVGALVKGAGKAAVTNVMGFYSISLPEGKNWLEVSYPGYVKVSSDTFNLNSDKTVDFAMGPDGTVLDELIVHGSKNNTLSMDAASVGVLNLNKGVIASTPVIFGESDVIKTLQLEPGVSAGVEGMAGMYVHGGNADENMYMLDNIPLYQVNHVGGLFSAFNTEAIRNVDFYKSSFPAKYDGRLSSYMDVHTKDGSLEEHHGSFRLGLTSGAFNIDGPIWKGHTSYSVALRRSWFDILTIPGCAIYNSFSKDENNNLGLAFTDINAKVNHRFSDRSSAHVMFYYGQDYLYVKQSYDMNKSEGYYDYLKNHLRWGNMVVSAGWNYVLSPKLFGEFTAAYTRYMSKLTHIDEDGEKENGKTTSFTYSELSSDNNINDWIFRGDFEWHPHDLHSINFGAYYTRHSFLPFRDRRTIASENMHETMTDKITTYHANEFNIYGSGDWTPFNNLRLNYGLHYSLFNIEGRTHQGLSPRVSLRWSPAKDWAVKAGYSKTVQYVHQLIQSSISLPTDQWIPILGAQKPQTADKIAAGVYYSPETSLTFSVEGY